jgi:hypothetical protein
MACYAYSVLTRRFSSVYSGAGNEPSPDQMANQSPCPISKGSRGPDPCHGDGKVLDSASQDLRIAHLTATPPWSGAGRYGASRSEARAAPSPAATFTVVVVVVAAAAARAAAWGARARHPEDSLEMDSPPPSPLLHSQGPAVRTRNPEPGAEFRRAWQQKTVHT